MNIDNKTVVLIVDEDLALATVIERTLRDEFESISIEIATDGKQALEVLERQKIGVALVDTHLPDIPGIELLSKLKAKDSTIEIIMISAFGTIELAIQAVKQGALDFLTKPFERAEFILHSFRKAAELYASKYRLSHDEPILNKRSALENIIGNSQPMQRALQSVKDVAQTEATVLIHGESGTGKELVAQAIHYISKRKDCPFVAFNCSALNESIVENELFGHVKGAFTNAIDDHRGLFEVANHGTLFLDEIGDMPLSIQAKLLRALQQGEIIRVGSTEVRKIDVRVIAATNKKLEELIQKKEFREDLYYRLNVINLDLPSLRERKDDIELLSLYFLDKYKRKNNKRIHSISPEVLQVLKDYSWPGNVRELENTISRAVILEKKDVIQLPSLPQSMIQKSVKQASFTKSEGTILNIMSKSLRDAKQQVVDDFEKRYLDVVLKRVEGNISQAANLAGIERSNFRKLLTNKGIDIQKYKKTN